jgi:hypothetical protein
VQWERRPWFVVTLTGYARFFNAETDACDDMSLGVWWGRAQADEAGPPRRRRPERPVQQHAAQGPLRRLRRRVSTATASASPTCGSPTTTGTDTWFFLVDGPDHNHTLPNTPATATATPPPPPPPSMPAQLLPALSPLVDPSSCLERAQRRGDWGELALCYMAMAKGKDPGLRFAYDEVTTQNSMWYVPTYYGKVFHPRSLGHEVVRDKVYQTWREHEL